ncbi:GLPGLI family protein [Winogradskyella sp.]|jgi:GLPGLI family protein|uniref:GLPGLI family protein n=1 Tax=Winogradskyella sp. TaxID=1883156 RepID=UPI0025D98876|nr:GLPGLI family protein [Winogradskyella sp.]MCT4630887.1 GLPGLI family protein [Winogradskyella sp.]
MATIIRVLVLTLSMVFSAVGAQDFQGVATYKTQRKIDIKMDSTSNPDVSKEMHAKMMEMMKKQFQKTFILTFNKEESIYKQEVELDKPNVGLGGSIQIVTIGDGGGSDVLYKNTKEQRYAEQVDTYGKIFLVKDHIEKIDWKLGSETKYIGEYPCYKATYTKMVPKTITISSEDGGDNDFDTEPELEESIVTAWYTPQIPINNGPDDYQGLPGLILEVHDGDLTVICSKIVLNPKEKVEITEPTKGKEVNQEKYEAIMEKKAKEMMERYRPKKGDRNDGNSFSISIGG